MRRGEIIEKKPKAFPQQPGTVEKDAVLGMRPKNIEPDSIRGNDRGRAGFIRKAKDIRLAHRR